MKRPVLIIPACGNLCYADIPAYIAARPSGELLIAEAVRGINLDKFESIAIVIKSSDNVRFNAECKIRSAIRHPKLEIITLDKPTSGPAITVLEAIRTLDISGPIVVKDADNRITFSQEATGNFVVGIDIYDYPGEIRQLKNKSFLVANEQRQLLDVVEKRISSPTVCLGVYGFESALDFVFACERLLDPIYNLSNLYVSEVITYLMGYSGKLFEYVPASDYVNWGNQYDLQQLMKAE